jgi:hypothetical protein
VKRPLPNPNKFFAKGTVVNAKYSEDGKTYKAEVQEFLNGSYLVRFTEYDNYEEWVPLADVQKL